MRCDLGSVDNPHDPPCLRCRREAKECYFSATRRKKKNADGDSVSVDEQDDYEVKAGRKRLRADTASTEPYEPEAYEAPRTPGGSIGRLQPLRRPAPPKPVQYGEEDHKTSEQTVGLLQGAEVHSGHDALKVLYEAAALHGRKSSKESSSRPALNGISPASAQHTDTPIMDKFSYSSGPMAMLQSDPMWKTRVDATGSSAAPAPTGAPAIERPPVDPNAYAAAIKAWSRFRFVRAGWFTAKEAIDYVDYFYQHLSPLTPIVLPDFRTYDSHEKLLTNEPMLTITILLISSRHMKLEGPGSVSRPHSIHEKLWNYLSGMIHRIVWGQEQFGGGFCGAGAEPGCDVNPLSRKGLRTLGTVESLVLLTEWHPRAMHFPPDDADEELMIPDERVRTPEIPDTVNDASKGIGGQRMDAWLEPCWRSDRMCWMLLGISMSLAFEIGVFDSTEWQRHARSTDGQPLSADDLQTYDRRRGFVRDVLLVYVTQTSGRIGLTSMMPKHYTKPDESPLCVRPINQHESSQETVLHFWLRMAAIMRDGNETIFANKKFTRDLIKSGMYKGALEALRPPLRQWRQDFDRCTSIPTYMRYILDIEYYYCSIYINALSLQAVAERCANGHPHEVHPIDPPTELARSAVTTNGVRTDLTMAPQMLAKWLGGDRSNLLEVAEGARSLLKVVVDGLYPSGFLKNAPVRTYFRIISGSIMLLKSFSLGANESDMTDSLSLMDRTVEALRGCIVDDVHVASRFADLLDTLTQNLKPRLVRIAAGKSHRVSQRQSVEPGTENDPNNPQNSHSQSNATLPGQNQWNSTFSTGMTPNMNGVSPSHPLYGVSNDTYDLMGGDNNFSIMPPPSFGISSPLSTMKPGASSAAGSMNAATTPNGTQRGVYGGGDPYAGGSGGSGAGFDANATDPGAVQDWFALPLDNILGLSGAEVDNTMYGPTFGGQDMLELLLNPVTGHQFHGAGSL